MITVVIPVYNTGTYLRRCLDSVLEQTIHDMEIICVDDGSTDDSSEVLSEYASKDSRIRVETFENNKGLSAARNWALDIARGEYIYFLDSDDWIDSDYLKEMLRNAESTGQDIVINSSWLLERENPPETVEAIKPLFVKDEPAFYSSLYLHGTFFPVVWCRLYKTKFLRDNRIRFPDVLCAEDNYFTFLSETLQKKVFIFPGPFYHYRLRSRSLSTRSDAYWWLIVNFAELYKAYKERNIAPSEAKRFYAMPGRLVLDSKERYEFAKAYFKGVESDVVSAPHLYSFFDCYVMKAIATSKSYCSYKFRYRFGFQCAYHWSIIRNCCRPSVETILNGKWKV